MLQLPYTMKVTNASRASVFADVEKATMLFSVIAIVPNELKDKQMNNLSHKIQSDSISV